MRETRGTARLTNGGVHWERVCAQPLGGVFVFRLDAARRTDFKQIGDETHWDFFLGGISDMKTGPIVCALCAFC